MLSTGTCQLQPFSRFCVQVLTALMALLVLGSAADAAPQSADEDYSYARGLYRSKRYDQAERAFDAFLKRYPEHPRAAVATLYHGLALSNLSRYKEAREKFDAFIRDNPENANLPDAQYRSGECSYYLRDFATAEEQLNKFRTANPDHALVNWAYLFEAESQLARQKWKQSEDNFRTLLGRNPEQQTARDAQYGLARSLEGQQKISDAFDFYRKLVAAQDPVVTPRALSRMGSLYFKASDLNSAVKAYSLIDSKYPASPLSAAARLNTGLAYYRLRDYDNAIAWLKRAGNDKSNRPRATILHAISLQKKQQYAEADTLLETALNEFSGTDSAPEILYYRADGMRLAGRPADAVPVFERITTDWPASPFADDALFFAADSAVQARDYSKAGTLLDKLEQSFPSHTYKDSTHLLRGRILAASGTDADLRTAVTEFESAGTTARNERTRLLSRYYLARTQQRLRQHQEALTSAEPVLQKVTAGEHTDLGGILVLAAVSNLAVDKADTAAEQAGNYLDMFPTGSRRVEAHEARAIARARKADRAGADADLKAISDTNATEERRLNAVRRVAEVAWENKNFAWSADLFKQLTAQKDSSLRPAGLSGLGWSHFEQNQYDEAAAAFSSLVTDHPTAKLAGEAMFMLGESYRRGRKPEEALTAYQAAFEKFVPATPAAKGAEFQSPTRFAFEAGRNAARLLESAGRTDDADQLYERLMAAFPEAGKLDEILERWAFMHLDAQNFARSDELFRKLIEVRPQSPLVPNARLALAESDMVASRFAEAEQVFEELRSDPAASESVRGSALFNLITINDRRENDEKGGTYVATYLNEFPGGDFAEHVRLFQAEGLIREGKTQEARSTLQAVQTAITAPDAKPEPWHGRVLVLLAETFLRDKDYGKARETGAKMLAEPKWSDYFYQIYEILGRSYFFEAPPNFDRAREYFSKAVSDPSGARTPTAAKCHLFIGDTWVRQQQHARALEAYQKVYFNFAGLPDLQAAGLFQAAGCEEALNQPANALKSYRDLVTEFPTSQFVEDAKKKIAALEADSGTANP